MGSPTPCKCLERALSSKQLFAHHGPSICCTQCCPVPKSDTPPPAVSRQPSQFPSQGADRLSSTWPTFLRSPHPSMSRPATPACPAGPSATPPAPRKNDLLHNWKLPPIYKSIAAVGSGALGQHFLQVPVHPGARTPPHQHVRQVPQAPLPHLPNRHEAEHPAVVLLQPPVRVLCNRRAESVEERLKVQHICRVPDALLPRTAYVGRSPTLGKVVHNKANAQDPILMAAILIRQRCLSRCIYLLT